MATKPAKTRAAAGRSKSGLMPGLSVVIPMFNEAKGLARLHERIAEVARFFKVKRGLAMEVVYVDDGSRDDSSRVALGLPAIALDDGLLRVLPQRHGTDGAFAARLRRGAA